MKKIGKVQIICMIDRRLAAGGHKNGDDHPPPEVTDFETAAEYECELTFDDEELQQVNQSHALGIFLKLKDFSIFRQHNRPLKTTTGQLIKAQFLFSQKDHNLSRQ